MDNSTFFTEAGEAEQVPHGNLSSAFYSCVSTLPIAFYHWPSGICGAILSTSIISIAFGVSEFIGFRATCPFSHLVFGICFRV